VSAGIIEQLRSTVSGERKRSREREKESERARERESLIGTTFIKVGPVFTP
jgi:hypothetical protein